MSEMQLSFEQLRQDIFDGILESLPENSHSFAHAAASYSQDPGELILPNIESCLLLGRFGSLVLPYDIPNRARLTLSVTMTLGRLNYTIQAHDEIVELCDLVHAVRGLAEEGGLIFSCRAVNEGVRMELANEVSILSAPSVINILRQGQLELAFKEFVRLQADRVIIGLGEILAQKGIRKTSAQGVHCLAVFQNLGYDTEAKMILKQDFEILDVDSRDPLNIIYSLRTKEPVATPLMLCQSVEERLREKLFRVCLQPSWGFKAQHESLVPVILERIVVETRIVEKEIPEMDWKAMIREPLLD